MHVLLWADLLQHVLELANILLLQNGTYQYVVLQQDLRLRGVAVIPKE